MNWVSSTCKKCRAYKYVLIFEGTTTSGFITLFAIYKVIYFNNLVIVCVSSSEINNVCTTPLVQFLSEYWELDQLDLLVAGHDDLWLVQSYNGALWLVNSQHSILYRVAALPDDGHPLAAAQPHDLHWLLQPHVPHHEARAWGQDVKCRGGLNTCVFLIQSLLS